MTIEVKTIVEAGIVEADTKVTNVPAEPKVDVISMVDAGITLVMVTVLVVDGVDILLSVRKGLLSTPDGFEVWSEGCMPDEMCCMGTTLRLTRPRVFRVPLEVFRPDKDDFESDEQVEHVMLVRTDVNAPDVERQLEHLVD